MDGCTHGSVASSRCRSWRPWPPAPGRAAAPPSQRPETATVTPAPTSTSVAGPASSFLYDPTADARADIADALARSKADGLPVLLDFGADWCPDCHVLSAYLDSPEGRAKIGDRAHIVRIDVGNWDRNLDVARDYDNVIEKGIPAVVVVNADGSVAGTSADGALANARTMSMSQVLDYLGRWVH